jgi:hypothetical protein
MVQTTEADAFMEAWRAAYVEAFPERSESSQWLVTRPSGPAREESHQAASE